MTGFDFCRRDPDQDTRHRTLVATLDWSYENLQSRRTTPLSPA